MSSAQREFTEKHVLLDTEGHIIANGWCGNTLLEYRRDSVPLIKRLFRLRECERYIVSSSDYQLILSIRDNGYFGMVTATIASLSGESETTTDIIVPFPFGRMELPPSAETGDVIYRSKRMALDFTKSPENRHLRCQFNAFDDVRPLYVNLTLDENNAATFCSAVPFDDSNEHFSYNGRTMGISACGKVVYGGTDIEFSSDSTFACHEWSRAVVPSETHSILCEAFGTVNGNAVGFSFGTVGTEGLESAQNAIFCNGEVVNIGKLKFEYDTTDHMKPWRIRSGDRNVFLEFTPISGDCDLRGLFGLIKDERRYAFGHFNGQIKTGKSITEISDMVGFVEDYYTKG